MYEKILDSIFNRSFLVILIIGLLAIVSGATGEIPILDKSLPDEDSVLRISFGIIGGIMVFMGLFKFWKEGQTTKSVNTWKNIYLYSGLDLQTRSDNNFQDFHILRPGGNINAVSYLWADTYVGNTINAFVDNDDHFLRIEFNNKPGSYPSNLAIRPNAEKALENTYSKAIITFEARTPNLKKSSKKENIAFGVRVVNGWLQHWEYSDKPGEYRQFQINNSSWKKHQVELHGSSWNLFQSDGNRFQGPTKPDFNIITAIVIEVGTYNVPGRLGNGAGIIDIRQIKLEEYI